MELKKNPRADLGRLRPLFLQTGLVVSLLLVVWLFSIDRDQSPPPVFDPVSVGVEIEMVEVTQQDFVRPPVPVRVAVIPQAAPSDIIEVVRNDAVIADGAAAAMEEFIAEEVSPAPKPVEEEAVEDELFVIVEEPPLFMGRDPGVSFRSWVERRLVYPNTTAQGRVVVAFIIERDGTLTNFEFLGSYDQALADEAMRVVRMSPAWTPARNGGEPIRLRFVLPVEFRLQ